MPMGWALPQGAGKKLRIWGSGVRISSGAPPKSPPTMGQTHVSAPGESYLGTAPSNRIVTAGRGPHSFVGLSREAILWQQKPVAQHSMEGNIDGDRP